MSLQPHERVLDIGSGDGKITALLSKKLLTGSILGVDISEAMVDFASLHYSQNDYPNLTFLQLDAAEISFENQFDRVVSFSTLHWVIDQEKALKALYHSLLPGGQLCIQTYGKSPINITSVADALIHTEKWANSFPSYKRQRVFFADEEYRNLLECAGFHEVSVIGTWHESFFTTREALINFAKPLLNFISHLPKTLQQEFTEEVVDRVISMTTVSDDGIIHYKTFNLLASGIK